MPTKTKSIRVPDDLLREIDAELQRCGTAEWSAGVIELLHEAISMRRAPGIVFADSPSGRRAVLAGTGLEVWEIVSTWLAADREPDRLRQAYDWLTEPQIRAALAYYDLYPAEVDARIARETHWTVDRVGTDIPSTSSLS